MNTLTPRQIEVLRLVAQGFRDDEIAGRLKISRSTVRLHIGSACLILGALNRAALAYRFSKFEYEQKDRLTAAKVVGE